VKKLEKMLHSKIEIIVCKGETKTFNLCFNVIGYEKITFVSALDIIMVIFMTTYSDLRRN
jgi:hypothetical protein